MPNFKAGYNSTKWALMDFRCFRNVSHVQPCGQFIRFTFWVWLGFLHMLACCGIQKSGASCADKGVDGGIHKADDSPMAALEAVLVLFLAG
jgi:hypothetical protein